MAIDVAVYYSSFGRSETLARAMWEGIRRSGDYPTLIRDGDYKGVTHSVAVFYGLYARLSDVFREYPRAGRKAVYIDLGYWGRTFRGKRNGYHKVVVNSRHPNAYYQRIRHDSRRASALGHETALRPWRRNGQHILLAGMGPKACAVEGFVYESWERDAIAQIQRHTDRPIIYRPKPSDRMAKPLFGTKFSNPAKQPLADVLRNCHAVVTHHSNVAVDALVSGVPAYCWHGVGATLGQQDLRWVENPWEPETRQQWVNDIAYCQWHLEEMREGAPWRHLKQERLI
jgi:hypothetical protein